MLRSFYTGTSGLKVQEQRMNNVANNLANVNRTGFKRDVSVMKAFPEMLISRLNDQVQRLPIGSIDNAPVIGMMGTGVESNQTFIDFSQGSLVETEHPYDLGLEGQGFFVVETPQGERYTRNGEFILGKEGYLETKDGLRVLGENGPIQLKLHNFRIDRSGDIFYNPVLQDDPQRLVSERDSIAQGREELLDTLKIVGFDRPQHLEKMGSSLFKPAYESNLEIPLSGEAQSLEALQRPVVRWKMLEKSNINAVAEMVSMIEVQRAYEANQKIIQTDDQLLGRLINGVGDYA
ncbi:flagellar hook-basal body protein [Candidatus Haliotispira prima]|uniref:Flagellar hook-basal body protein n=1 Tax=Candidatus Haliotispira prima TaxID=3034016 RepID=A0ABY8MIJ0_9SPIO|nr:flagellar hook-basal body protein [Candidatus Haliotispira prima]